MLAVRHIGKSYGAITVLDDISFIVNPNDRIGIVGSNGVGKTTLLNILIGKNPLTPAPFHSLHVLKSAICRRRHLSFPDIRCKI